MKIHKEHRVTGTELRPTYAYRNAIFLGGRGGGPGGNVYSPLLPNVPPTIRY